MLTSSGDAGPATPTAFAAAMIKALEALLEDGVRGLGILLVVGEEVDGAGARHANQFAPAVKYLINGEPTEEHAGAGLQGHAWVHHPGSRASVPLGIS